jgi:hypothetical protein
MNFFKSAMLAIACISAISVTSVKSVRADSYGYYPNSVLHLGGSFDPRRMSSVYLPCIAYDGVYQTDKLGAGAGEGTSQPPIDPIATSTEFSVKEVKTRQELYDYLHVSVSVSGHYNFFSGGASVDYERENTFESDSFTWIVRGYSAYGGWALRNPRLNAEASKLKSNINALYQRCGTEWVGKESRAVMIAVVYSVKNLSSSSRERLVAAFKGGIDAGVWGAEAAANYESFKKEASSAANLNLNVYAMGGPGITAIKGLVSKSNDINEIKKIIEEYTGKLTADNSVPVDYLTGAIAQFATGNGDFDLAIYNKAIADLFLAKEDYVAKLNRLREVIKRADDYNLNDAQLVALQTHYDGIAKVIASFESVAAKCRNAFLSAQGSRNHDVQLTTTACNVNSPSLVYKAKINWPPPQPFAVTWWTEDNQFAPKRWLYVLVKGTKLAEASIIANDGTVLTGLKVEPDSDAGKKATGALEFSSITAPKFPLRIVMKSDAGQDYTKELNLTPQQALAVKLAIPATANSTKLVVKPLSEVLKLQDLKLMRENLKTNQKVNSFQ